MRGVRRQHFNDRIDFRVGIFTKQFAIEMRATAITIAAAAAAASNCQWMKNIHSYRKRISTIMARNEQ